MATIAWFLLIGAMTSCFYKGIDAKSCCQEWRQFGDSCYFFSTINRNWTSAQENCKKHGGYLTELGTVEEFNFMRNTLREIAPTSCYDINWYLGASDVGQEGKFIWMHSKTDIGSFLVWESGEPNNYGGDEDCMAAGSLNDYRLNDLYCHRSDKKVFSICEKPAD